MYKIVIKAKLRHDVVLCGVTYKKDTVLEILKANDPLVQKVFKGIKQNDKSNFVAVQFPGRNHATLCLAKTVEFIHTLDAD